MVYEDLMLIHTFSPGSTKIYAETFDGKLKSNKINLEIVRILTIRVVPSEVILPAGSRRKLDAICTLHGKQEYSGIHLTWLEDDSSIARVSSSGMVWGAKAGKTQITALDESCKSDSPANIEVTTSEGKITGKQRGKGYPMILVSEIDIAPGEETPAVFQADEPPVMQRTKDVEKNIWWINLSSPFARLYFSDKMYGVKSEAWRMYHIERYIDIIVQIALTQGPDSDVSFGSSDWIYRSGEIESEIRVKAVESIKHFIQSGMIDYSQGM